MKRLAPFLFVFALGCDCWNSTSPPAPPAIKPAPPPTTTGVRAHVYVVDMAGRPIKGMMPIATVQPNAFDKPLARGDLTGSDGRGIVVIPADRSVCVRAWDPQLHLFANNYHEVPPGPATDTGTITITMLPGASLRAQVLTPGVQPAAGKSVDLMLFHPTLGAWWPARADTDDAGKVFFSSLPPGVYTVKIESAGVGAIELAEIKIDPGGEADLGPLVFE